MRIPRLPCALAIALFALTASAQTPLATYAGPDRMQKLIEGAKKEGEVVIYTSAPVDDMKALTDAFEKKYGVKAKIWRASSEKVMQRALTETRNNRFEFDIVETNGPELEALVREKVLQPVKSPSHADLIPQAIFPHSAWVGLAPQHLRRRLQHEPGEEGGDPEALGGVQGSEVEGPARHRGRGCRLVRERRAGARRRGEGRQGLPRHRRRPTASRCAKAIRC